MELQNLLLLKLFDFSALLNTPSEELESRLGSSMLLLQNLEFPLLQVLL